MQLSKRDIQASDPGNPFGGGTSSFGGSQQGGYSSSSNPAHTGPPPAAVGATSSKRCNECGKICSDGQELEEHMRQEHMVRGRRNDVTVPAALIFIDALGDSVPFKKTFTFKELSDFCRHEGVHTLTDGVELSEQELIKIAEHIELITKNNVRVNPEPTRVEGRNPLSLVDLKIANAGQDSRDCVKCGAKTIGARLLCSGCHAIHSKTDEIHLYAHVVLNDGTSVHVVEANGDQFVGVDDLFEPREFTTKEALVIHNMEDDLNTVEAKRCDLCGEECFEFSASCSNCGNRV